MKFYGLLMIAIVTTLLLAELSPTAVNAFLILLILGVILGRYAAFEQLVAAITSVAK